MAKKKWISEATKNAHGQFAARAKNAGMSTRAYARQVMMNKEHYSKHVQKQAQLAMTLMKMHK